MRQYQIAREVGITRLGQQAVQWPVEQQQGSQFVPKLADLAHGLWFRIRFRS